MTENGVTYQRLLDDLVVAVREMPEVDRAKIAAMVSTAESRILATLSPDTVNNVLDNTAVSI